MTPVLLARGLTLDLAIGEYPAMLMAALSAILQESLNVQAH